MHKNKTALACILLALFSLLLHPPLARAAYYGYDALNRLTRVFYDNGTVVMYTYDEVGNRVQVDSVPSSHTITAAAVGSGSISPQGISRFAAGDAQTYTITPDTGHTLTDVQVDGMPVGAVTSYTFSDINANHSITALFAISTFTVTPLAGAHGVIAPAIPLTVEYNASATFALTPDAGYNVAAVTGCGGTLSGSTYTTGPITDNCAVQAIFAAHTYSVPGSALALSLGEATYPAGGTVTPTITNSGQMDTSVQYTFSLLDSSSTVIASLNGSQSVPAEASLSIPLEIPAGALDGLYIFKAEYLDMETGATASTTFPITINGVKATLSVQTSQQVFLTNQTITGLSTITNTGPALQDGNLHLQIGKNQKQKTWTAQSDWQQGTRSWVDTLGLPDSVKLAPLSDTFDSGPLNTDRWNPVASAAGGAAPTVKNGRLYMVMPNGGWNASYVDTKAPVIGDFDAEVSYEVDATNYSNGNNHPAGLVVWQADGFYMWVDLWGGMIYGTYDYPYQYNNAGGGQYKGKFKIRRAGSTYSSYFWNGTSWTNFLNRPNRSAGPAYMRLIVNGADGNVRTYFDNFTVTRPGAAPEADIFPASGTIRLQYDGGVSDIWDKLSFAADIPPGTSITFRTRTADTEEGLNNAPWSSAITASGSPITSPKSRWIAVEATLATTDATKTPVLHDLSVTQGTKPEGVLWQADVPVSVAANAAIDLTSDIGTLGAAGRYTLTAILTSSGTNQKIATAEYPFDVEIPTFSTVTPSAGPGGNISPSAPQAVPYNETTTFTVTPDVGYKTAAVSGCGGTLSGNAYTTGLITGDCPVSATFVPSQFPSSTTVSSSATANTSNYGEAVRFTATVSGSGGIIPAGTVQFKVDDADFRGPVDLLNGSATSWAISSLAVGGHAITAVYSGDASFISSSGTLSLTVNKATPALTWNTPTDIPYGTALDEAQLNATASLPGTFTYTPATGTVLSAGNGQILQVNFTPADTTGYASVTATVPINVTKATPAVSVTEGTFTYDGAPHAATGVVSGVGGENLGDPTFTYTPGGAQAPVNVGEYLAEGTFAGNDNYAPATGSATIVVMKADQAITFGKLAEKTYGDAPFAVNAAASSGLPVSFSASGNCAVSDDTVTVNGAGNCSITAAQAGSENFHAASPVSQTFSIAKAPQTITWSSPADIVYGTELGAAQLNAEVSVVGPASAGALTYSPAPGTILSVGESTLYVSAAETDNYLAATKSVSLTVRYGFKGLLPPYDPTKAYKINRAIPLKWQYASYTGMVLPSATANPSIIITKGSDVVTNEDTIILDDAGNSGYQYDSSSKTWQYNWKTTGLTAGTYFIHIKSTLTGQVDGPFMIQLSN